MESCDTCTTVRPTYPKQHGTVHWDWGSAELLEQARRAAHALERGQCAQLRHNARRELGLPVDTPVVASGHQPLPVHPGIAMREMLLDSLPDDVVPLWILVDSDAPAEVAVRVPMRRRGYTHHQLVLLENPSRRVLGAMERPAQLNQAWPRLEERLHTLHNKDILRRACAAWDRFPSGEHTWSPWIEQGRRSWGGISERVRQISVIELAQTESYRRFVHLLLSAGPQFTESYNAACRQAGVRPLSRGGIPFWSLDEGRRTAADRNSWPLLPRALLLTLAVRALLCDVFLHGAGGASYEPGTDSLWRSLWNENPPPWGWITGTFALPEPSCKQRLLPQRDFPFFLHDAEEVHTALRAPLSAV